MIIEKQRNATLLFFKLEKYYFSDLKIIENQKHRCSADLKMFILGVVQCNGQEVSKIAHVYK